MAYVPVPKDLNEMKTKVFGNFSKRQIICLVPGAAIGFFVYFKIKNFLGSEFAILLMMVCVFPFIFLSQDKKDGFLPEEKIYYWFRWRFIVNGIRYYKTDNFYKRIGGENESRKQQVDKDDSRRLQRQKARKHTRNN